MSTHVDHFRALAAYNAWMNEKLYTLAATLSDEERKRDLGAFFGSLHGTLNHLLVADRFLLGRFRMFLPSSLVLAEAIVLDDFEPRRELCSDYAILTAAR